MNKREYYTDLLNEAHNQKVFLNADKIQREALEKELKAVENGAKISSKRANNIRNRVSELEDLINEHVKWIKAHKEELQEARKFVVSVRQAKEIQKDLEDDSDCLAFYLDEDFGYEYA